MTQLSRAGRSPRVTPAAVAAAMLVTGAVAPAHAQSFELIMQGALDARSALMSGSTVTSLAAGSAFTVQAFFNASSPNLVAGMVPPGFRAYTPSSVLLTMGGRTYTLQAFDAAHPAGVSVAIFDGTTPFGPPGHYAVGLIQDPVKDGAGIVPDFVGASPAYNLASGVVVPATFTGYFGVGVQSGVCTVGGGANCQANAVTPIPMTWSGQSFGLVLGTYDDDAPGTAPYTASIAAVPEPGSWALCAAGLTMVAGVGTARRRRARPTS